MKIPVILNGEKEILDADPEEKLEETLRRLELFSVKEGCQKGCCGACVVLLDGKAVPSCVVPVGTVRNSEIETLEFFIKTKDGQDIKKGFDQAGITLCGFCNAARFFTAYNVINLPVRPSSEELEEIASSIECSCTDSKKFINGMMYATAAKHSREGRKHVI